MEIERLDSSHFNQIAQRLRVRLDLANFKCKYGYQNMDLRSLETLVTQPRTKNKAHGINSGRGAVEDPAAVLRRIINTTGGAPHKHRYYPVAKSSRPISKRASSPHAHSPKHVASPTVTSPSLLMQSSPPMSAKRSTYSSRTDELTAQLLLWMCRQKWTDGA
ncbi:hypothetical protein BC940DRAFT_329135 [Gongronella butleri]|nr:hypothetical protein BC940DRAFT_329135 [Gongronella butleri]